MTTTDTTATYTTDNYTLTGGTDVQKTEAADRQLAAHLTHYTTTTGNNFVQVNVHLADDSLLGAHRLDMTADDTPDGQPRTRVVLDLGAHGSVFASPAQARRLLAELALVVTTLDD